MRRRQGTWQAVAAAAALGLALACAQPSAKPYVGEWHRTLAAGDAVLVIKPTGMVELHTPGAPGTGVMKGPALFHVDTATFTGASCERGEARYRFALDAASLVITPLGTDGCTRRRETLGGTWARR